MIGFAETLGATLAAFLGPAFLGLLTTSAAARVFGPRHLAAFSLGLFLWFFADTLGDASLLGLSEGFGGGVWHLALWGAFAVGLLFLFSADTALRSEGGSSRGAGFAVPLLVAVAVGVHGFGEGAAVGATAATTQSASLLDAFGGFSGAAAFLIHKLLEPAMVGTAYWVYAKDHACDASGRLKDLAAMTILFALPGVVGGATSYFFVQVYPSADFTYAFALGLGTCVYAAFRLARPLFDGTSSGLESIKVAFSFLLGFTCLYLAALLHS